MLLFFVCRSKIYHNYGSTLSFADDEWKLWFFCYEFYYKQIYLYNTNIHLIN